MRFTTIALALALAGIGGPPFVEAGELESGPRIAISIPTQGAGKMLDSGRGYGVTATFKDGPRRGFGADVAYYRWPGAPDVDRSLDQLFSSFSGEPITGSRTTVSVVQATLHGKFFALERGRVLPWMKVGLGFHRLNTKLELPMAALQAAGVRVEGGTPDHISNQGGLELGAGFDLAITAGTKLSLDASYLLVFTEREPFLTALAIGVSLLKRSR